ncbi:MAG: hypothetical protein ACREOI_38140 [bacterium]
MKYTKFLSTLQALQRSSAQFMVQGVPEGWECVEGVESSKETYRDFILI